MPDREPSRPPAFHVSAQSDPRHSDVFGFWTAAYATELVRSDVAFTGNRSWLNPRPLFCAP